MKPTWTKVYSGPGYPIDPKKQSERDMFVWRDFVPTHPNDVVKQYVEAINSAFIDPPLAVYSQEAIDQLMNMYDAMQPPSNEQQAKFVNDVLSKPKCNCPACTGAMGPDDETVFRHMRRHAMIHTEDFQSRLMEIQVKERGI